MCAIAEVLPYSTAATVAAVVVVVVFDFTVQIDSQFLFRFIGLEIDLRICMSAEYLVYFIYGKNDPSVYTQSTVA